MPLKSQASLFLIASLVLSISEPLVAEAKQFAADCEQHISAAARTEGIPPGLLYAMALTESGSSGRLQPYALNIEGEAFIASSQREAMTAFDKARKDGKDLIDLGCMQINYFYHHAEFQSAADMLDPHKNISYAAKHLKSLQMRHGSWTEAVARYHAGPKNKAAQHRYVCKVLSNLVNNDFGNWTPSSKSYCESKPK